MVDRRPWVVWEVTVGGSTSTWRTTVVVCSKDFHRATKLATETVEEETPAMGYCEPVRVTRLAEKVVVDNG